MTTITLQVDEHTRKKIEQIKNNDWNSIVEELEDTYLINALKNRKPFWQRREKYRNSLQQHAAEYAILASKYA